MPNVIQIEEPNNDFVTDNESKIDRISKKVKEYQEWANHKTTKEIIEDVKPKKRYNHQIENHYGYLWNFKEAKERNNISIMPTKETVMPQIRYPWSLGADMREYVNTKAIEFSVDSK